MYSEMFLTPEQYAKMFLAKKGGSYLPNVEKLATTYGRCGQGVLRAIVVRLGVMFGMTAVHVRE